MKNLFRVLISSVFSVESVGHGVLQVQPNDFAIEHEKCT